MKFNYKKIVSILASGIMLASTVGFAAAAAYPEPFVASGTADSAVIVGANAATSDWAAAIDVKDNLNALVTEDSSTSATGGDSYTLEKTSTKFQMGYGVKTVISTDITDSHLPTLLADGKYVDDDNDEFDYDQKITLANSSLGIFDDNDYQKNAPTVGIRIANGKNVLNYTLDMNDEPLWSDLATSTLPLLGKEYYVLAVNSTATRALTLLDSAGSALLAEGETTTISVEGTDYEVSVNFIGSTPEVKLEVNGEVTNTLNEAETQKLSGGVYIGIKDILYTSKESGVSKVEFSIGSGKLKLTNNSAVELNEDSITDLKVLFTESTAGYLGAIKIWWNAKDDLFIAPNSEVAMPGFEVVKLSWGGMTYPEEEEIRVEADGDNSIILKSFPLKDSSEDINILYWNDSDFTEVGEDTDTLLRTPGGTANGVIFENATEKNITFDADTDEYFVISWNDTANSESYLAKMADIKTDGGREKADLLYKKNKVWTSAKDDATNGTTVAIGNAEMEIDYIDDTTNTVVVVPGSGVSFGHLFSKEGLKIWLPFINVTVDAESANKTSVSECNNNLSAKMGSRLSGIGQLGNALHVRLNNGTATPDSPDRSCYHFNDTYTLMFREEDKDGNIGKGKKFNASLAGTSVGADPYVSDIVGESTYLGASTAGLSQIGETKVYRGFVYGPLGTEILWDKVNDQYIAKIIYHGSESYGKVLIASPETVVTPGETGGGGQVLFVKDSEISSVSGKNLIVIGGSCINSVAAKILGSDTPMCEADFTAVAGAGAGQYIIKTIASPYNAEKIAMLVAGYEAADTTNAVAKALEGVASDVGTEQVYPITTA